MNEGEIRVRGLEAVREWVSKDDRYISMIGECEIIRDAVNILGRRTIGEGEEGEEGVSVREKNGILGIVLEVVEGGGWKGKYEELEEVVGRLEEEGKKRWKEKREEKGRGEGKNDGREWKEMGRLAHCVGWAIEERKGMSEEGRGGDGEMISLRGMKKNLEEERKKVEEKDKQLEREKKGREEEKNRADEEKKRADEEAIKKEEEKRKREEGERKAREEKNTKDERIRQLEEELSRVKEEKERLRKPSRVITSIQSLTIHHSHPQCIDQQGNRFTRKSSGDDSVSSTIIGEPLSTVCIVLSIYNCLLYNREYFLCFILYFHLFCTFSPLYILRKFRCIKSDPAGLFIVSFLFSHIHHIHHYSLLWIWSNQFCSWISYSIIMGLFIWSALLYYITSFTLHSL